MNKKLAVAVPRDVGYVRDNVRHRLKPEAIQHLDRAGLLAIQEALGFGVAWGAPEIPLAWVPPGPRQALGNRRIDFASLLDHAKTDADHELARLAITRFALLHWLAPRTASRSRLPAVATWFKHLRCTVLLADRALSKPARSETGLFDRLDPTDFEAVYQDRAESALRAWLEYADRGLLDDCPRVQRDATKREHDRRDEATVANQLPSAREFTPYPDDFIAELGWRVAWFVEQAGPALLDCAEKMYAVQDVGEEHAHRTDIAKLQRLRAARKQVVCDHDWASLSNHLPFELHYHTRRGATLPWPPTQAGEVKNYLSLLQSCHLVVLLLSTGSRAGEVHSLRTNAATDEQRLDGRTYKLVFAEEGAARDWPLPELGVQAANQQARLAAIVKQEGRRLAPNVPETDNLWVRFGHGEKDAALGDELRTPASALVGSLVEYFGLTGQVGEDTRIHAHRFRKTLARLVALAVVGAPKILMDLFGHKTIEMTLTYILSDKALRAEVEEVAKAQTVMLAERIIATAEQNGGPAAAGVAQAVRDAKARKGEEAFGAQDVHELAEILTLGGRTFQLVRPGVLCVKQPQQAGWCTKLVGHPEPSRCGSTCAFRLEEAAHMQDVDDALAECVARLERAQAEDDAMQAALWEGQVLAHLPRFEALRTKWSTHPTVATFLSAPALAGTTP